MPRSRSWDVSRPEASLVRVVVRARSPSPRVTVMRSLPLRPSFTVCWTSFTCSVGGTGYEQGSPAHTNRTEACSRESSPHIWPFRTPLLTGILPPKVREEATRSNLHTGKSITHPARACARCVVLLVRDAIDVAHERAAAVGVRLRPHAAGAAAGEDVPSMWLSLPLMLPAASLGLLSIILCVGTWNDQRVI